jgi:catechol 2,3-dioxygenase-like lactoylglutathione lyase family enzyme
MTDGIEATTFLCVHPVLAAEDLAAALAYYRDRLGITVAWQSGSPPLHGGGSLTSW